MTIYDYNFILQPLGLIHFYVKYPSHVTNTCRLAGKQQNHGIVENVVIE